MIFALTLAAGYYVPLYRTHKALVADYAVLAERVTTAEKDLVSTRAELAAATTRGNELAARHRGDDATKRERASRLRRVETDLSTELAPLVGKQELSIGRRAERVLVALPSAVTESHGHVEIAPSAQGALCAVATTLSSGAFAITIASLGAGAATATNARGPWDDAAARAAAVARALEQKCHYPADKIATTTHLGGDEARIELEIDSTDR